MRFHTLSLFSAFGGLLAQAFIIPPGTMDGVYAVIERADGVEEHVQLAERSPTLESTTPADYNHALQQRDNRVGVHCGCGNTLDHNYCNAAVANLKNQINQANAAGKQLAPYNPYYSIYGGVVAFICNRGSAPQAFPSESQVTDTYSLITRQCGGYIAGAYLGSANGVLGYQRYKNGDDFCTHSTDGTGSSC